MEPHICNPRLKRFNGYSDHAWHGKRIKKLTIQELQICQFFLEKNALLDRGEFEKLVNRMFMDQPARPKNWGIMQELLSCANSG